MISRMRTELCLTKPVALQYFLAVILVYLKNYSTIFHTWNQFVTQNILTSYFFEEGGASCSL